jgi:hypothetical protein
VNQSLRDQYTTEAIYRLQLLDHVQVSPSVQVTINSSETLEADVVWVTGFVRLRIVI